VEEGVTFTMGETIRYGAIQALLEKRTKNTEAACQRVICPGFCLFIPCNSKESYYTKLCSKSLFTPAVFMCQEKNEKN